MVTQYGDEAIPFATTKTWR